jgi:biopolymer transport protein ExbD
MARPKSRRPKKNKHIKDEAEMSMTPMIDIVFQLLIFFLVSAKFITFEGQLSSYLPKDRGLQSSFSQIDLANVSFFLQWLPDEQKVRLRELGHVTEEGSKVDTFEGFGYEDGREGAIVMFGPTHDERKIKYGYQVPNYRAIEAYLTRRHLTYSGPTQGTTRGIPVTINVGDAVPMQMVTNIVDICTRVGITNVTIAAKEKPID